MVDGRTRYRRASAIVEAADGWTRPRARPWSRASAPVTTLRAEVEWLLRATQEEDPAPPPPQDLSGAVIEAAAGSDYTGCCTCWAAAAWARCTWPSAVSPVATSRWP